MAKYRNKITYLSFILSALIVVRHAVNIEVYEITRGALYWIERFFTEFTDLMVPMFFAMSGYLFFQDFEYSKLKDKWKRRIFSVLIPYLIWNLAAYLYYQIIALVPFIRDSMNQSLEPFNLKWLLLNTLFDISNHQVTWFLQNLLVYIFVVPAFYKILKKKYISVAFIVLFFLLSLVERQFISTAVYGLAYNAVFYMFGAYMGIHFKDAVQKRYDKKLSIAAFIFILVTVGIFMIFKLNTIIRIPVRLIHIVAIWLVADVVAVEKKPWWWIQLSFFIYCTHSLVLESLKKVVLIAFGKTTLGAVVSFISVPVLTIIIIVFLAAVLRRIKPLWKVLTGNRGG